MDVLGGALGVERERLMCLLAVKRYHVLDCVLEVLLTRPGAAGRRGGSNPAKGLMSLVRSGTVYGTGIPVVPSVSPDWSSTHGCSGTHGCSAEEDLSFPSCKFRHGPPSSAPSHQRAFIRVQLVY